MKILEAGHKYELAHLESEGHETLTFIKRSSDAVDYGTDEHPGTNTQEVIRALIDRTEFLHLVLPSVETLDAAWFLRMALFCYEARAYRRKQQGMNKGAAVNKYTERYKDIPFNEQDIEKWPVGSDGHIIMEGQKGEKMADETSLNKVIKGLQIIQKYSPNAYTGAGHDHFFVYDCPEAIKRMSKEDRAEMERLEWGCEDKWYIFV